MLSVETLRKTSRMSEAYSWLIDMLKSVGFETDGWQPGRIQRSIMTTVAAGNADLSELGRFVVEFGFGPTSSGPALTLFSESRYGNKRNLARKAAGPMRLRNFASSTHPLDVGRVIVSDGTGVEFRNVTGGTLLPGSAGSPTTLDLQFEAVLAGAGGSNVSRGSVNKLVTQYAGVTVSNDVTPSGEPWYTTVGLDEEFDTTLRRRNETKWALTSLELVKEGFEAVALANGGIKIDIDDTNPRGQGTLDVYAASALTLLSGLEMQALQYAFSRRVFHTDATWQNPWPSGNASAVQVKPPPTHPFSLPGGVVYYSGNLNQVKAGVRQALLDLVTLAPIGGYDYSPGPSNVITIGDISDAIEEVDQVETTALGLTSDVLIPSRHLIVRDPIDPYFGLTFTAVNR